MPIFTGHLKKKAKLIHLGLELLESYCEDLEQSKIVSPADMRMATYAMQTVFENIHLSTKESILHPALLNSAHWPTLTAGEQKILELCLLTPKKSREHHLEVRLSIDQFELDPRHTGLVGWRLADLTNFIFCHLEVDEKNLLLLADEILNPAEQKGLLNLAQKLETSEMTNLLYGARLIFSRLRNARGMTAA